MCGSVVQPSYIDVHSCTAATKLTSREVLSLVLGNIPGVNHAYALLKKKLYGFVDPESKQAGRLCTIL